jgi:hypothetical protein
MMKMRRSTLRLTASSFAIVIAAVASAESYQCVVWGPIPGFTHYTMHGAGDNALMSGSVRNGFSEPQKAIYRTEIGYKMMHPSGWHSSVIMDSWGSTYHCGYGAVTDPSASRALFWIGGGSAVDLHPAGYTDSLALGGGGQLQVGYVVDDEIVCEECGTTMQAHASSWSRTAASFRRLHSLTHKNTAAVGTDGTAIVGYGIHRTDGSLNALYWKSGTAMGVNIRPSGSTQSQANSVWGTQQGGYFQSSGTGGFPHGCIWAGTAASVIDLNPGAAFRNSEVLSVRDGLQVGFGNPLSNTGKNQAIAWHGSAATWINLHARLPSQFATWSSRAVDIDNLGNIVGFISEPGSVSSRAVVWYRVN